MGWWFKNVLITKASYFPEQRSWALLDYHEIYCNLGCLATVTFTFPVLMGGVESTTKINQPELSSFQAESS